MSSGRRRFGPAARAVRIVGASCVIILACAGLFDIAAKGAFFLSLIPALQIFPSAVRISASRAAGAFSSLLMILLFSAIFGRWYCAALCPLGTLQDACSSIRKRARQYRKPAKWLRISALAATLALASGGAAGLASWLDPWSIFGRFMAYDIQPLYRLALRADNPGFRLGVSLAAGAAVAIVLIASVFHGRWFCGHLCPVGTLLGIANGLAPFRLRFDEGKCVSCGKCASVCAASCLDANDGILDPERCVYCLDCLAACPASAIGYGREKRVPLEADAIGTANRPPGLSRSRFLASLGGGAIVFGLVSFLRKGANASIDPVVNPGAVSAAKLGEPLMPVLPPGAGSVERFTGTCLACGLCAARCPAKIIRPSTGQLGMTALLVPRLDYDISYCQYECTACMDVCPSGALEKLDLAGKKRVKIGDSSLVRDRCVVITNRTRCGACAEHCPTGAVKMVMGETGLPEPVFDSSTCIGCGACHHACPVKPDKAISVSGYAVHGVAKAPSKEAFSVEPGAVGVPGAEEAPAPVPAQSPEEFPF
ncbi:MAG TPA: 4Fe-4S binding protein [Rectinemataceae bacterium]